MVMESKPSGAKIIQRQFRKADLPRIIDFRKESLVANFPGRKLDEKRFAERLLRAAKNANESIRGLEKAGSREVIGYVWFGVSEGDVGRYGYLRQIFVREDFRKQGLAKKLLEYAEDNLASKGAKSMRMVVTDTNCRAVRFYEKMNYRKTRLVMEKRL